MIRAMHYTTAPRVGRGLGAHLRAATLWLAVLALLGGCAATPTQPVGETSTLIGMSVERGWLLLGGGGPMGRVYFAQWDGQAPLEAQQETVPTNYQRGHRMYLLNAPAGGYAPIAVADVLVADATPAARPMVAAMRPRLDQGGDKVDAYRVDIVYLPAEIAQRLQHTVAPGSVVFLGNLRLNRKLRGSGGDPAQRHFHRQVTPELRDPYGLHIADPDNREAYLARDVVVDDSPAAERRFLQQALDDFAGTAWEARIRERLAQVGSAQ